jgi:hypothetical protein
MPMLAWIAKPLAETVGCWAETAKDWTEPFEQLVVGLASIVGGAWVLLRLYRERAFDSALTIDIHSSTLPAGGPPLTFVEVTLTNVGKVKLQAKPARSDHGAYDDGVEKLRYGCGLKLKKLDAAALGGEAWIDWFDNRRFTSPQLGEINLLSEYEDPKRGNRADFWMEPGEVYHLGAPVALPGGVYLAKVTFVGARADSEFWSRIAVISV